MIKIENTDVYGFESAIRGMRNPRNSLEKSDSWHGCRQGDYGHIDSYDCEERCRCDCEFCIGHNDMELMKNLVSAGSDHSKFMRMITVTCDITAPMYWWKEMDNFTGVLDFVIDSLNAARERYIDTGDKRDWWQIIQLLPSSYNQRVTWQANYDVLRNIYHARKNHKLDCWKDFCRWIESLPYSELITGGTRDD